MGGTGTGAVAGSAGGVPAEAPGAPVLRSPAPPWWRSAWGWLAAALPAAAAAAALAVGLRPLPSPLSSPPPLAAPVPRSVAEEGVELLEVEAPTVAALERLFEELDYRWPPRGPVPAVALRRLPRDLPALREVERRKGLFLRAVLPLVLAEDARIRAERRELQALLAQGLPPAGSPARRRLEALSRRYRVRGDLARPEVRERLLARVDEIPPALALAQAAIETGWGTSRFALEGNNLFGQWTRSERLGLVPAARPEGRRYAVRAFADLRASVRAYLLNLNTHRAYRELRSVRRRLRAQGRPLEAQALAAGLWRYSQRGLAYVAELQAIIRANRLHLVLREVDLRGPEARELVAREPARSGPDGLSPRARGAAASTMGG